MSRSGIVEQDVISSDEIIECASASVLPVGAVDGIPVVYRDIANPNDVCRSANGRLNHQGNGLCDSIVREATRCAANHKVPQRAVECATILDQRMNSAGGTASDDL